MSRSVWQVSINAYEEVLSTEILFETREQADRYIALAQTYPEIVYGGMKIDPTAASQTQFSVQPIPIQDTSFITELENFVEDAKKKEVEE